MIAFATCPACGELAHHDLCRPALAALYADERIDHEADRKRMALLESQLAAARQELADERQRHTQSLG